MPPEDAPEQTAVGDIDEASLPADKLGPRQMSKARRAELARTWGIQVGAYGARTRATEQASIALSRLMTLYPNADVLVQPIKDAQGRTLYRAQVVGLQQADVAMACQVADIKTKAGCKAVPPLPVKRVARR